MYSNMIKLNKAVLLGFSDNTHNGHMSSKYIYSH